MERSGTRRGIGAAGLLLSLIVAACSGAAPSTAPGASSSLGAVATEASSPNASAMASATPEPLPAYSPTPAPSDDEGTEYVDGDYQVLACWSEVPCEIHRVDADGADLPGWPVTIDGPCQELVEDVDGAAFVACDDGSQLTVHHVDGTGSSVAGWPIVFDGALATISSNDFTIGCGRDLPAMRRAAYEGNPRLWVAVAEADAVRLHALGLDGRPAPGWPQRLPGDPPGPDGSGGNGCRGYRFDPSEESVVAWGYEGVQQDIELIADRTEFTVFEMDGRTRSGWPRGSAGAASGPVITDGLTYTSASGRIWRHARNGDVLPGWGYRLDVRAVPIVGSQDQVGVVQPRLDAEDRILVIESDGRTASGFPRSIGGNVETRCLFGDTPCAGDVAPTFLMNGTVYVALGNGGEHEVGETGDEGGTIVAFDIDGRPVDGWPVQLPDRTHATWMAVDATGALIVEAVTCGSSCGESSTPVTLLYDMEGKPTVPDGGFGNLPDAG